jgi:hypothetical protein
MRKINQAVVQYIYKMHRVTSKEIELTPDPDTS